jgi:hypothetical protein
VNTRDKYYCPACDKQQLLTAPCVHIDIEPGALLLEVREATDGEQREALERTVQLAWQDLPDGRRLVENIGAVALEVVSVRGRRPLPPGGEAMVEVDEAVVTPEVQR